VHLLDDEGGRDGPQRDIGDGSFESEMQIAVHAGLDRSGALALRLIQLLGHLADHEHQQADVVDGGDEEAAQAPFVVGRRALRDRGHGQVAARRIAVRRLPTLARRRPADPCHR